MVYVSNLKVLWVSEKNGNGICLDNSGNECYIDSSINGFTQLKRKDIVFGKIERISGTLCIRSLNTKFNSKEVIKN